MYQKEAFKLLIEVLTCNGDGIAILIDRNWDKANKVFMSHNPRFPSIKTQY